MKFDVINNGDSLETLRTFPDEACHLILSDIPYGIGAEDWDVLHSNTNSAYRGSSPAQKEAGRVFKSRGKPLNGWSEADKKIPLEYYQWCASWATEWLRILKPGGSAIIFSGRRLSHRCICALEDAGFTYKDMLAWLRARAPHRAQRLSVETNFRRIAGKVGALEISGRHLSRFFGLRNHTESALPLRTMPRHTG
jgi:site-specific DNA-methyltransferase (adenine-specific)